MRQTRILPATLALLLAASLPSWTGCGGSVPETGTTASPVNKDEAASQNKAMQDMYSAKPKKAGKSAR